MVTMRAVWLSGMLGLAVCFPRDVEAQTPPGEGTSDGSDDERALLEWRPWDQTLRSPWESRRYAVGHGYHDYPYYVRIGRRELHSSFRHGRAVERYRQNVFELRKKLEERLRHTYRNRRDHNRHDSNGGYDYRYNQPWWRDYFTGSPLREFYDQGRELEYHRQQEFYLREQLTLLSYRDLFDRGIELFRNGSYGQAARAFVAAADKNHEDAAARIHAAQALTAVGMYDQAMKHVRRAFELQPLLMQLPLNLATDYGDQGDYVEHVAALAAHVKDRPDDDEAAILLAYVRFFSADPQNASDAMARIKPHARKDPFVRKLLAAAAPVVTTAR